VTIALSAYKASFDRLAGMDPSTSWVHFKKQTITVNDRDLQVLVPQVQEKPWKIIRFVKWFFGRLFRLFFSRESQYLTTAKNLCASVAEGTRILKLSSSGPMSSLLSKAVESVLTKLEKKHPEVKGLHVKAFQQRDDRELKQRITALCVNRQPGPSYLEIAYAMDWTRDDPVLFDPTYVSSLIHSTQRGNPLHPDLKNLPNSETLVDFLSRLMYGLEIQDRYGATISKENTDRLRQMMLAIMNTLNAKRGEADFQTTYKTVVLQVCLALRNCSNGINTNVEGVYNNLAYPKGGNIGQSVKLALQSKREEIFRKCILNCLSKSDKPAYYLSHEAASVNYYFRRMGREFGLPPSISEMDNKWEEFALIGGESAIRAEFRDENRIENCVKTILDSINNPHDPTIATKLFNDWIATKYSLEERYGLLDEQGKYKPECIIQLMQELGSIA
jgi:hypothetical protein